MGPDARQAPARRARADARRRPATAKAVALRTSTRIVEDGPIGLAVFLASGKRRGRLGDLLGDTIVARPAPGLPRAGFSPLLIAVPAGIAVAADRARARLLRALRAPGLPARRRQDVRAQHGRRRARRPRAGSTTIVARTAAEHRALAAVKTPGSARKLRAEILALDGQRRPARSPRPRRTRRPARRGRHAGRDQARRGSAPAKRYAADSACAPARATEARATPPRGNDPPGGGCDRVGSGPTLSHALTSAEPWPT